MYCAHRSGDCVRLVCVCVWVRVCVFEGFRACVSVRVWVWLVYTLGVCEDVGTASSSCQDDDTPTVLRL